MLLSVTILIALAGPAQTGVGGVRPKAVSPGGLERFRLVESRCPTFSWSEGERAAAYELLVYRLDGQPREVDSAELVVELPAGTGSWAASGGDCLEHGGRYAWTVRALGDDAASEWAEPRLFRLSTEPSTLEVERALQTLREYVTRRTAADPYRESQAEGDLTEAPSIPDEETSSTSPPTKTVAAGLAASGVQISASSILIGGDEVVTTATDQDTLGAIVCQAGDLVLRTASGWECIAGDALPLCDPGDHISCYGGDPSTIGIGVCQAGTRFCNSSGTGFDACVGDVIPSAEVCDALDNDCDAAPDDAFDCIDGVVEQCGVSDLGICQLGQRACSSCSWGPCIGNIDPIPGPDVCGGGDTDCDGAADEDYDCEDNNECTEDLCDFSAGCSHTWVLDNTPCTGGTCQSGVCVP